MTLKSAETFFNAIETPPKPVSKLKNAVKEYEKVGYQHKAGQFEKSDFW